MKWIATHVSKRKSNYNHGSNQSINANPYCKSLGRIVAAYNNNNYTTLPADFKSNET